MIKRNYIFTSRYNSALWAGLVLVVAGLGNAVQIEAAQPCTTLVCPATQVCVVTDECMNFDVDISNITSTANSFSARVNPNAYSNPPFSLSTCLGSSAACQTPAARPTLWTNFSGGSIYTANFPSLREGTTYSAQLFASLSGVGTASKSFQATTWPGYPSPSSISGIQPLQATVNWTTPFPGDSEVTFGVNPPGWTKETLSLSSTEEIFGLTSVSSGTVWAVTSNGGVLKRSTSGTWSAPLYPDPLPTKRILRKVDAFDGTRLWAVGHASAGQPPIILRSTDGSSWTVSTPPAGLTTDLYGVATASPTTAWAVGGGQKIIYFNGSAWVNKPYAGAVGGESLFSVVTLDDKTVVASGTGGQVLMTQDGGTTWAPHPVPNGGSYVNIITTIDGNTLWAGDRNGKLWRGTIGSGSIAWFQDAAPTPGAGIYDIQFVSPTEIWFNQTDRIGHYTQGSLSVTYDTTPITQAGDYMNALTIINPTEIIAGGGAIASFYGQTGTTQNDLVVSGTHSKIITLPVSGRTFYYAAESFGSGVSTGTFGSFVAPPVDPIPPTITITVPNTTPVSSNQTAYTVAGQTNDNFGLQSVTLTQNGNPVTVTTTPALPGSGTLTSATWTANVTLATGTNTFVATATDTSLNNATDSAVVVLDTQAPTVTITAPATTSTVNTLPLAASGGASDNDKVVSMEYQLNGGPRTLVTGFTVGTPVSWTTSIPTLISGSNTLIVYAKDTAGNEGQGTAVFTYAAPTFTLSIAPATPSTAPIGTVVGYTVTVTSQNGFSGAVALTGTSTPSGLGVTFNPASVTVPPNGSVTSLVSVTTASGNPVTYTVSMTGTQGTKNASATVQLTLTTPADFTISASPNAPAPNLSAGQSGTYAVTASANSTFAGLVTFSVSGLPTGVTGVFAPNPILLTPGQSNNSILLTVTTTAASVNGSYTLTLTAASGSITHSVTVPLIINDFSFTLSPASQTVTGGGAATFYAGSISSNGGFAGLVTLIATETTNNPNIKLTLSTSQINLAANGSTPFILNAQAGHPTPQGTYNIQVSAKSGALTRVAPVQLVVTEDTTAPVISAISANPNFDKVTISWTTDEPTDGHIAIYSDSGLTSFPLTIDDLTFCTATPCTHSLMYTPLTPLTTYFYTVSSADQAPIKHTTTVSQQNGQPLTFTTLAAPDTIAPTVTVTAPAASSIPPDVIGSIPVTGQAQDNASVDKVTVNIISNATSQGVFTTEGRCPAAPCATLDFALQWPTSQADPNGVYSIHVKAFDLAGNFSTETVRQVNLVNDFEPPRVLSGPDVVVSDPCVTNSCTATVTWSTHSLSTSVLDFGLSVGTCDSTGYCSYTPPSHYDDKASNNPSALYRDHKVTLTGLEPNQIYHFRITSCNGNNKCTN